MKALQKNDTVTVKRGSKYYNCSAVVDEDTDFNDEYFVILKWNNVNLPNRKHEYCVADFFDKFGKKDKDFADFRMY